jgi:hypothetical protein
MILSRLNQYTHMVFMMLNDDQYPIKHHQILTNLIKILLNIIMFFFLYILNIIQYNKYISIYPFQAVHMYRTYMLCIYICKSIHIYIYTYIHTLFIYTISILHIHSCYRSNNQLVTIIQRYISLHNRST